LLTGPTFPGSTHSNLDGSSYEIGTPLYRASEVSSKGVYDQRSDIYSLGLIYFELLCKFSTLHEKHITFRKLTNDKKLPLDFVKVHPVESELIAQLTHEDLSKRPHTKEIKNLPSFKNLERLYKVNCS
jgi:serine/threonine protein kinase